MRAIDDAEASGTDFWTDRLLARTGIEPAGTWLMTRGRAAFMYTHHPSVIGFGGNAAHEDNISSQNAYAITASPGTFTEQPAQRPHRKRRGAARRHRIHHRCTSSSPSRPEARRPD
ncbi:hypothetical protein [Actinoplanes sp. NPDC048796]|uniref:hypothetical protein n=1 Tax=Actinoplanes sp. NPDC048796 TaxID=3155640 RepID=UPI00340E17AE